MCSKILGLPLKIKTYGSIDDIIYPLIACVIKQNKPLTSHNNQKEAKSKDSDSKIQNNAIELKPNESQISGEIRYIENILLKEFSDEYLQKLIDSRLQEEQLLNNNQRQVLLQNIQNQIINLEMAQYAESITKVESLKKQYNCYRLSCDPSDKLPAIKVTIEEYKHLLKFRDSSNFLFSLDKSNAQSHIFM